MSTIEATVTRIRARRATTATPIVSIIGHVERLGPVYDDDWIHFSVNLTAALDPAAGTVTAADVKKWLSPWTWTWNTLAVLGVNAANKTVALPAGAVDVLIDQALATPTPLIDGLIDERDSVIASDVTLGPFMTSITAPVERATAMDRKMDGKSVRKRHWKSFLTHASTFPAPLPQSRDLKLSVFFRIKAAELADLVDVVASPIFAGDPFDTRSPELPSLGTSWDVTQNMPLRRVPASGNSPERYEWDYVPLTGMPPVVAGLNRCPVTLSAGNPNSLLDFETLWVKDSKSTFPEDWTVRLEAVLADAFDFPRRLLDALQANLQHLRETRTLAWPVDTVFHEAFIASLRDLANSGLASPPDRKALAEALIADLPDGSAALRHLETHQLRYRVFDAWRERVKSFVAETEPIDPFPAVGVGMDVSAYARALEHIYTVFATEANLTRFFIDEWDAALGGTPFWTADRRAQVIARVGELQLRKRLATGNVGVAWRRLRGDLHSPKELIAAVQQAFHDYVRGRFANPPTLGYEAYLPPVTGAPVAVLPALEAYAASFVTDAILPRDGDASDPGSLREDLVIQVDRLQRIADDGSSIDSEDYLRRLSGVGVLLRRKGQAAWRCLNLAKLEVNEVDLSLDPVSVPLRLGYRNGLRSSYLAYSNQPMAARSPATELSHNNRMTAEDAFVPFIGYDNPYTASSAHRLEPLIYGEDYEAAVFMIGNAGNLPRDLTRKGADNRTIPWQFNLPSTDPPGIQTLAYRRRVPVGQVRLFARGTSSPGAVREMDRLPVPAIPPTVHPLTRSIRASVTGTEHRDRDDTIVLLTPKDDHWVPGRHLFEFDVRPPSVPLEVWDRWVAADPTMRDRRIEVWTRYHERADLPAGDSKATVTDISIDDPSVKQVQFSFERIYPQTMVHPPVTIPLNPSAADCTKSMGCVQAGAIPVEIYSAATLELPSGSSTPVRIGLPAGEIWRVEIQPVISDIGRFHRLTKNLGDPVTLYVEVADRLIKAGEQVTALRKGLNEALSLTPDRDDFAVTLTPSADPLWDRLHRVELMLQRWRWDGRPLSHFTTAGDALAVQYRFPFHADPATQLEQFDGSLFASRESSDHLVVPSQVDFAVPARRPATLFTADLSALPGALYFRAAVRVYSRYEGLLRRNDSIDSRTPPDTASAEQWRRAVVSCRWRTSVPRPVVKLVLPLTRAAAPTALSVDSAVLQASAGELEARDPAVTQASGLLVVLDESWYSDTLGGIAEVLEWDLARTALPDLQGASRLQFGPDPLIDLGEDPLAGRGVVAHQAVGAIGYTHDTGTAAPLFTRASFVIPPPTVEGLTDLSWFFLQLRFRRRLDDGQGAESRVSLWTDPLWAQLLPASNFVRVGAELVPTVALGFNPERGTFTDRRTGATVVPASTQVQGTGQSFSLWLLVTRGVTDALGRAGQEAFVTMVRVDPKGPVPVPEFSTVRLVEVQHRPIEIENFNALVAALFPAPGTDAQARIVRVSPPLSDVE